MRQWHVPPEALCDRHLLGEHVEHHMFVGHIRLGRNVRGYIERGLLDVRTLWQRHDEIVVEMLARGFDHQTPLAQISVDHLDVTPPRINPIRSLLDLSARCPGCRIRVERQVLDRLPL